MTEATINFGYVWGLAAEEELRRAVYVEQYGQEMRGRFERERRGFARICELITFLEANEKEITAYLRTKRKRQDDDSGDSSGSADNRKQATRAR